MLFYQRDLLFLFVTLEGLGGLQPSNPLPLGPLLLPRIVSILIRKNATILSVIY